MYKAKQSWVGKVDFDLGSEIGTRTLTNNMPQEHLERIFKSHNGQEYVEQVAPEAEKKNGLEAVSNGEN